MSTDTTMPGVWVEHFAGRYQITNDCWEYTGHRVVSGYGHRWRRGGGNTTAHRLSWVLANGVEVPTGLVVMHSCDNPPCINPAHLSVGTHTMNMLDMVVKGRHGTASKPESYKWKPSHAWRRHPERIPAVPRKWLTEALVLDILRARKGGMTYTQIAERFGVGRTTALDICAGRRWATLVAAFKSGEKR